MHAIAFCRFILITACLTSVPALAGVGGTSAGVTTNIPGQSTDPSADVQAQSAGFVQQNQQLQNGATPSGSAVPASTNGTSGTNAVLAGAANSAADGNGKPKSGDPASANAQPAAPPTPPPPPPTYVSVVKHVTPQTPDTDSAAKPVTAVPVAVIPAIATPVPTTKPEPSPTEQVPVPVAAPRAEGNLARAKAADANVAKNATPEHAVSAPAVTGGRGEAPDGFAFYTGLGITILLLAVALATYLRTQRDEAAIRPPGG